MRLEDLCEKIDLPLEVKEQVLLHAEKEVPEELLQELMESETGLRAYEKLKEWCEDENHGFDMLAYHLKTALYTYENYRRMGISDDIFFATMGVFPRFVREHKASFGYYGFDRGWWTYRQLSMVLFRIGELEYEFNDREQMTHMHIPTGADISVDKCEESFARYHDFVKTYYAEKSDYKMMTDSWLLSPGLVNVLGEDSKILKFQKYFKVTEWKEDAKEFLQWVYGRCDIAYEELPETTSLQKKMKEYLLQGGKIGVATGLLNKN